MTVFGAAIRNLLDLGVPGRGEQNPSRHVEVGGHAFASGYVWGHNSMTSSSRIPSQSIAAIATIARPRCYQRLLLLLLLLLSTSTSPKVRLTSLELIPVGAGHCDGGDGCISPGLASCFMFQPSRVRPLSLFPFPFSLSPGRPQAGDACPLALSPVRASGRPRNL